MKENWTKIYNKIEMETAITLVVDIFQLWFNIHLSRSLLSLSKRLLLHITFMIDACTKCIEWIHKSRSCSDNFRNYQRVDMYNIICLLKMSTKGNQIVLIAWTSLHIHSYVSHTEGSLINCTNMFNSEFFRVLFCAISSVLTQNVRTTTTKVN